MSLPFAKLSQKWAPQGEIDNGDDVEILHHRNVIHYNNCNCRRCVNYRYHKAINELEEQLGRRATQDETQRIYAQLQIQ